MMMAQRRLSVRSVHEVMRLRYTLGRSLREIAAAVGISGYRNVHSCGTKKR